MPRKAAKKTKQTTATIAAKKPKKIILKKGFPNKKLLKERKHKFFFATAFVLVGILAMYVSALNSESDVEAVTVITSFQAEDMPWSPITNALYSTDGSASGGHAIKLSANATGTTAAVTTGTASELRITASGGWCFSTPNMQVKLDGITIGDQAVGSGKWTQHKFRSTIPPGAHDIDISFTNHNKLVLFWFWTICSSSLSVDKVEVSIVTPDSSLPQDDSPSPSPSPSSQSSQSSTAPSTRQSTSPRSSSNVSKPSKPSVSSKPSITPKPPSPGPVVPPVRHVTYTLEPFDFDGYSGINFYITRQQLGGMMCPCVKIPYVADGMPWNVQKGADKIHAWMTNGTIKSGDTVMGFSLGVQTISLYLSQHTPPPGVKFLLLGDTFWRNQNLLDHGSKWLGTGGIPWNIRNQVTMVVNEFDGWSDQPDIPSAPGYKLAQKVADAGKYAVHDYTKAKLNHPANVVTRRGNFTAILIPTQKMPGNVPEYQRPLINQAFSRPSPTSTQRAAATDEQVWP